MTMAAPSTRERQLVAVILIIVMADTVAGNISSAVAEVTNS
jgi:hypothetical protein